MSQTDVIFAHFFQLSQFFGYSEWNVWKVSSLSPLFVFSAWRKSMYLTSRLIMTIEILEKTRIPVKYIIIIICANLSKYISVSSSNFMIMCLLQHFCVQLFFLTYIVNFCNTFSDLFFENIGILQMSSK